MSNLKLQNIIAKPYLRLQWTNKEQLSPIQSSTAMKPCQMLLNTRNQSKKVDHRQK